MRLDVVSELFDPALRESDHVGSGDEPAGRRFLVRDLDQRTRPIPRLAPVMSRTFASIIDPVALARSPLVVVTFWPARQP